MMVYFEILFSFEVFSLFRFKTNSKKTLREQDETSEPLDAESESSFLAGLRRLFLHYITEDGDRP